MDIVTWRWPEIIAAGGMLAVLIVVLLVSVKKLNLQARLKGLAIGGSSDRPAEHPHKGCLYAADFMKAIELGTDLGRFESDGPQKLIQSQMKYFEKKECVLRGKAEKVFVTALATQLGTHDNILNNNTYMQWVLVMNKVREVLGDYFRIAMRDNGLDKLEGVEWQNYKSDFRLNWLQLITDTLNTFYCNPVLPRLVLYKVNVEANLAYDVMLSLDEALEYSRTSSIEFKQELQNKKDAIVVFLSTKITGEDNARLPESES